MKVTLAAACGFCYGVRRAVELAGKAEKEARVNLGAFLNNLNQSLQRIQLSGIPAVSERRETDSQIVLTITIPK